MSYILDALRRADSERERGAVPGVHAQVLPPGTADADPPSGSRRWLVISALLALALLAVVGWQWFGRTDPPPPPPEAAAVRLPLPVIEPPPPPPAIAAVPAPLPAASSPAAPAPVAAAAPKTVPRPAPAVTARTPASPPTPAPAVAAAPPTPHTAPAAPATPPPPARIPMASELPDEVRAGLPTLTVGGASYSQNPENRMLIVNGQVFREGDKLSGDVTLEQIRLKEAVLSARGVRYRIAY